MKTAFIIHGTGGNPNENWFPWMKQKLEEAGYKVIVPAFPTPAGQSLDSWNKLFSEYLDMVDGETIFIAHSVGPAFVLNLLEQISIEVAGCYFVSGFLELIQLPEFDIFNETITSRQFDWNKIHDNCKEFYMCHGRDDPYVPYQNVETLAENLDVKVDIIEGGGHLNSETGYTSFEYLLTKIISLGTK